MTEKLFGRPFL